MKRFKKYTFILFVLFSIYSCVNKSTEKWDKITTTSSIRKNKAYIELNKEKEVIFLLGERDSTLKKSSAVFYFSGTKINFKDKYSRHYTCEAYFPLSDTLLINIGRNSSFGSKGFKINLIHNKFHIQTYQKSDVINEFEVLPTHKIVYQKLILDKTNYKIGDSLFGEVEFKSIEIDKDENQIQHFGKGYFRTKIKEL